MAFKIKTFGELGRETATDRYAVVTANGKVICDCFGVGFISKQSAYDGFKIFNKKYNRWKTYQSKMKHENNQIYR